MGMKFEYEGATYDVPCMPKKEWKEWMTDRYGCKVPRKVGTILCGNTDCPLSYDCIYTLHNCEARQAFYYECFPEGKPEKKPSCEECANYKSKEELPKLTQEVFERPDCPEWAKWAAVDKSGAAFWYSERPKIAWPFHYSWAHGHNYMSLKGKFDATDWKNSLIERPAAVKRVDYKLLKEKSTPELEYTINQRIACGWVPKGGISFDSSTGWYMQAMIKKED